MEFTVAILAGLLALSLIFNAYLYKRSRAPKPIQESFEARHLLRELLSGQAIVKIEVLDPKNFFLRVPRG